jgi:hypothetical protein
MRGSRPLAQPHAHPSGQRASAAAPSSTARRVRRGCAGSPRRFYVTRLAGKCLASAQEPLMRPGGGRVPAGSSWLLAWGWHGGLWSGVQSCRAGNSRSTVGCRPRGAADVSARLHAQTPIAAARNRCRVPHISNPSMPGAKLWRFFNLGCAGGTQGRLLWYDWHPRLVGETAMGGPRQGTHLGARRNHAYNAKEASILHFWQDP